MAENNPCSLRIKIKIINYYSYVYMPRPLLHAVPCALPYDVIPFALPVTTQTDDEL